MNANDNRWTAVVEHDKRHDGAFVYAVKSTGIYCRPSCPSKRPRREQVLFYTNSENARDAGFRPCKRCNPDCLVKTSRAAELAALACKIIQESKTQLSLEQLSARCSVSPYHLQRMFKQVCGVSPKQYAKTIRAKRLDASYSDSLDVLDAIYGSGYESVSTAYSDSGRMGLTPSQARLSRTAVSYVVAETELGWLGIGATDKGVCKVGIYDTADDAKRDIAMRFPSAIARDTWLLRTALQALQEYIQGNFENLLSIPIDFHGTLFQAKVWEYLRTLPYGTRTTYSDIAAELNMPSAARAVANACANNEIAILIPCHRVVRADGTRSGYRWGRERKEQLLQRENKT